MAARTTARLLGAAAVAAAMAVGTCVVPAGAAPRAKVSASDCEALTSVGDNIDTVGGSGAGVFGRQAAAVADGLQATAKDIDNKKLKAAVVVMAGFYDDLSDAGSIVDAAKIGASRARAYGRALRVFTKATLQCVTTQLTLPSGVTLPTGVTLPSGVTLPKVPS